jgi:hypothetical protein
MTKRRGDVASRGAAYWITLGFSGRTARGLVAAGYRKLDDLKGMSREEVLAIPGFGERTLPLAERLLGSAFPSPREELRERGLPRVLSFALVKAGVDSWEKVERMTREQFIAVGNLGASSLGQLEALLGRRLDSPVQQLCAQGLERPTPTGSPAPGFETCWRWRNTPTRVSATRGSPRPTSPLAGG